MLFDTIQRKLMALPDAVRVFPAHGAGSACGKNLSTERQSTIGEQRRSNYACQPMNEDEFLALVTEGQPVAPDYFLFNALLNRRERDVRDPDAEAAALSSTEAAAALAAGAVLHDAREVQEFATGHLRGSINVPADGRMAETVGMVVEPSQQVVVLAPAGLEQETVVRLARIGYDNVVGFVADPESFLLEHAESVEPASRLTVAAADDAMERVGVQVVDIRNPGELAGSTIPGAVHIPLAELRRHADRLDPSRPVLVYCAGGWRSSVGASLLRAQGFTDVSDLLGGYDAWVRAHVSA
jgi:rhodanese-related sulfurtransferase